MSTNNSLMTTQMDDEDYSALPDWMMEEQKQKMYQVVNKCFQIISPNLDNPDMAPASIMSSRESFVDDPNHSKYEKDLQNLRNRKSTFKKGLTPDQQKRLQQQKSSV